MGEKDVRGQENVDAAGFVRCKKRGLWSWKTWIWFLASSLLTTHATDAKQVSDPQSIFLPVKCE